MNNNNYIIYLVENWWCFPPCKSGWRTANRDDPTSRVDWSWKRCRDPCPDTQIGRVTMEVTIFSYCRRKCTDSLITNVH